MQDHRDNPPEKVTPPSSFIRSLLTPPPTDSKPTKLVLEILRLIRQYNHGRPVAEPEWHKFKLQRGEYDDLLTLLKKEGSLWTFMENKLRYAWTAPRSTVSVFADNIGTTTTLRQKPWSYECPASTRRVYCTSGRGDTEQITRFHGRRESIESFCSKNKT